MNNHSVVPEADALDAGEGFPVNETADQFTEGCFPFAANAYINVTLLFKDFICPYRGMNAAQHCQGSGMNLFRDAANLLRRLEAVGHGSYAHNLRI